MKPIVSKSAVRLMNSSKNKLNYEIILIFNPNPNAHLGALILLTGVLCAIVVGRL